MLDSVHYMALKYLKITFWRENVKNLPYITQCYNERDYALIYKPLVAYRFYCMRYSLPDSTSCDKFITILFFNLQERVSSKDLHQQVASICHSN